MKRSVSRAITSLALLCPTVYAIESKESFYDLSLSQLGKVEITTATGNSTPLDKAPATATVISAADIRAMGARHLDDVLETVPGFHVSLSSLSRLDSVYSVRGIHTGFNPHVLLLMNGLPVQFSVQGGRPILFRYPVNNIDRIEIIRGPGSAIYGADAYSGVINVITKEASTIESSEVGVRFGSFDTTDVWVSTKSSWNDWSFGFHFDYSNSDGDDERIIESDLQTILDGVFGTSASLAPGALDTRYEVFNTQFNAVHEHWSINLWGWLSDNSGVGAGAAQALDPDGGDENELYLLDVIYKSATDYKNWDHQFRFGYQYYDTQASLKLLPNGVVVPLGADGNVSFTDPVAVTLFSEGLIGNPGGTTQDSRLEWTSIYSGLDRNKIRVSVGFVHQKLDTRETKNFGPGVIDISQPIVDGSLTDVSDSAFVFVKDVSRDSRFISVQDQWNFASDWELTAGIRYDDYSDIGSTTNLRGALVWAAKENLTTKILYGSAFRAPSFSEQFNANNPVSIGYEFLDPEKIDTYELVFAYDVSPSLNTTISLFRYTAKDMIEFTPDGGAPSTNTAENSRDQKGDGGEWEVNWDVGSDVRTKTSFSWSDPRDKQTGEAIADAPTSQVSFYLKWDMNDEFFMSAFGNHVAGRNRAPLDARNEIDDYSTWDAKLNFSPMKSSYRVGLVIKNIFDKDAREPSGEEIPSDYPLEGRSVWVEFDYRFE